MPAPPAVRPARPAAAHHVAYHQEPARRPMMAIMNPSHAAVTTPREPAGPRPKKRTPRPAQHTKAPAARADSGVFLPPGSASDVNAMMRSSVSTASTVLPAITPRGGTGAARPRGRALDINLEESGQGLSPVRAGYPHDPPASPAELHRDDGAGFSPQEIDSPSLLHTWIDPVTSRPTTREGRETSRAPPHRLEDVEHEVDHRESSSPERFIYIRQESSQSERSPEMIPVPGIGSVSVRLAADKDECVVDYSMGVDESLPAVGLPAFLKHEPAGDEQIHTVQRKEASDQDLRVQEEYRATSAYFVQGYATKEGLPGVGFSRKLMRLADPRSRIFQYPTPSEALHAMSKRPHERVDAPSSKVAMVGTRPPSIDQTFYTLQQMKRQWLMQYSKEEKERHDNIAPPRSSPQLLAPIKRQRETERTDQFVRTPPAGSIRQARQISSSRPGSKEQKRDEAGTQNEQNFGGSVNSPWVTSPADTNVQRSHFSFDAGAASKPSHGYSPTGTPLRQGKSRGSDSASIQECIQEAESEDEPLSPFSPAVPLSPGRPDAMLQGNAALAMHLSPIGEFSLDSSLESRESPQLQLGLSIQEIETHAMLQLASQGLRTPVMGPQQVGTSSPTTPWADKVQSDAGLFAAGPTPIEEEVSPGSPGRDLGLSPISRQSPQKLEGQKGMQVLGPGQLAAGFDFFEGSGNGNQAKQRRINSSSTKRRKTDRSSDRRVGPDHQVFAKPADQQEEVLFVNSPYASNGYSLVGEQPGLRPANELSLQGQKRLMIIQEMQKKHFVSDGNRAVIRCEEELGRKHLKNAVRDHEIACQFYAKADVLDEKHAILSDLHLRILEITNEYHAYQQKQAVPFGLPALDSVPTIRVPFRGPDRLQPDGLHSKSREEHEEMRRASREEEIRRREALMEDVKRQAELAAKAKLQEEEERARRLEEARVRAEQLEAARLQGEDELRRFEAEEAEQRRVQEEAVEAQRAAEEERRRASEAEEERRLAEQKLKEHLREGRRLVMAEAKELLAELSAAEERRALAEYQRIRELSEEREGFDLVFNPILHEMAASVLKELREEARHQKNTRMVGELIHHLLGKVHSETGRRENLANYAIATARETAACVERLICQLEAVETARLVQEEQNKRAREAEAAAYLEVQGFLDDLIDRVEASVSKEIEAEARRRAEEEAARAAASLAAATEAATIGCSSALLQEAMLEALLAIAREARDEVREEEAAERKRREEEQRLAEDERLRREEGERLAKLHAIMFLQACTRRIECGNLYSQTLEALFAAEERIRQEEERKRREEDARLATQRAAEVLQVTVRCKAFRDEFVNQCNGSLILQALSRRERDRLLYGQMLKAAVTLQASARMMLSRRQYIGKQSAAAALQGLLAMYSQRAQFRWDKDNARKLQAYLRSHLGQVNRGAGLTCQRLLSSYIRMQLPRQTLANYWHSIPILQAHVRLKLMPMDFREMQASASALQTCCRRMFAAKNLNHKLAVTTLEPFLLSSNARNMWSSRLLAASKLVWNLKAASVHASFAEMCQAAEFLQRVVQRNVDVSAYHSQALEAHEERKRIEEEEKARKREEEVAAKQKQIMEKMEADNKAKREAAEAEAAKELERKKMVAEYSHKAAPAREEPAPKKKEPKEIVHAKRDDTETFALAVSYEKEKMYDKAIAVLLKIMRVPALRMACLLKRATCLGKLGMRRDCLKDFEAAIREFSDEHLPFYMRALHHVQWQNDALAMRDIARALAIDPKHTESLNLQASLKFKHGYFVEAIMLATRTLAMKSDIAQLYIIRGLSRERLGLMKEARNDLATAIIMTLDALPRHDTQVGEDELKSLSTILTDNVFVTFCDACLVDGKAGAQQAVEVLKRMIDFTGTRSAVFAMRARAYCAVERFEDAEEDFDKAGDVEEGNPHFLIARAQFVRHTDPASAIRDCERAAEIDPENLRAHVVKGKICEEEHRSKEAVLAYKEALEREDTGSAHYEAAMRCGTLQYKISESSGAKKQEALSLLRDAARVHAPREDPLLTLARFLESAGSYSSAIRSLTRVIHMNPSDPRTYVLRSQCLLLAGNNTAAMRDRQTAMLLDNRTEPDVIIAQIDALIDAQDFARALTKVKDAIEQHPGHAHFKILHGKVLFLSGGEIDAAKKLFDEGLQGGNTDSQDFEFRGEFLLQTGSASAAEHDFERSIELDQTNTASYIGLGEARLKTGNSSTAAEGLDGALQLDPHNKRALHLRAIVYEKSLHFSDALAVYEKILIILESEQGKGKMSLQDRLRQAGSQKEHKYYFLEAHMKAGLLCTKMRNYPGAIEHYNRVLKVNRKSFQALLHRGIAFHSHGYHESAISDYNSALVFHPAHSIVLENRAKAFAAQKEWKRAINDIHAIKESERDAGVFALLSSCYSATDRKELALKAIDASLHLDGLSLHALISKADILEDLYPLQRAAMSCYSRALRLHAGSQLARLKHALAAAKRGFIDVAIKEVRGARAVAVAAGNNEREKIMIEELGALIMVEASMPVKASVTFDRLLASTQNDVAMKASLLTARGVMHQQGKDLVTARSDFAQAVQADPSDPEAHYNLGCFRMQEMDWRGSYAAFTKTLSLRPKHTLAMLNRGVSLYQMHRAPEALRDFNAALALQPDFGQALLNRGVMHQISGSHAEAEEDLSRAIVLLGGSKEALQSRVNFYQSVGRKDLSLRDNASIIALAD